MPNRCPFTLRSVKKKGDIATAAKPRMGGPWSAERKLEQKARAKAQPKRRGHWRRVGAKPAKKQNGKKKQKN
jgi:hypothetical protein